MARVFIDGFESQKWLASQGGLWDIVAGYGHSVQTGYETGYAWGTPGNTSNLDKYLASAASYYVGFHFKGYGNSKVFRFMSGTTVLGVLYYNVTSGHFYAYKGDQATLLQQGTIPVSAYNWCHIQMYYLPHATAGTFTVKVNGVEDFSFSGSTSPSTQNIDRIGLLCNGGASGTYFDNVVIDDSAWPGVSRIALLTPSGAGNSTQWDPSAGSNYDCVDEVPYSDADFIATNVVNEVDTYALSDLPASAAVVKCVQVYARARLEGAATPQNLNLAVRTTGGDAYSGDKQLPTDFTGLWNLWEVNPGTSNPWTVSEVNAMEAGVKSKT